MRISSVTFCRTPLDEIKSVLVDKAADEAKKHDYPVPTTRQRQEAKVEFLFNGALVKVDEVEVSW